MFLLSYVFSFIKRVNMFLASVEHQSNNIYTTCIKNINYFCRFLKGFVLELVLSSTKRPLGSQTIYVKARVDQSVNLIAPTTLQDYLSESHLNTPTSKDFFLRWDYLLLPISINTLPKKFIFSNVFL